MLSANSTRLKCMSFKTLTNLAENYHRIPVAQSLTSQRGLTLNTKEYGKNYWN
jgi:hypothetical protein